MSNLALELPDHFEDDVADAAPPTDEERLQDMADLQADI